MSLRVVSAYRPQDTPRSYTVYQQQVHYYSSINNGNNPIKKFDDDLCRIIEDWIENGDQVVVMIDANEELAKSKVGNFRHKMEASGLQELILAKHPHLRPPPPITVSWKKDYRWNIWNTGLGYNPNGVFTI